MRSLPDPYEGRKKLLVVADVQSGFHHNSINHAMATIEQMGRESGFYVSFLRTDSQLITKQPIVGTGARYGGRSINARNLDYFDAIFFLGSGEGTLSDQQKADLLAFVHEDGKGFIGGHAATVAFYNWPEYGEMIGGFMDGEFPVQPTHLVISDPAFPGAANFPTVFADQFPYLKAPYDRGDVHTIIRLDPAQLTPEQLARRPDGVLVLYPGNGTGRPGSPRAIDFGWQIFDRLIALQDFDGNGTNDLAGRRPDGTLWFYANSGKATFSGGRQIGTGWQIYDNIVGIGDADGDRQADFVGRQPDGATYFYPGTAMRDQGYKGARKIGDFGWDTFNSLTATKDVNGDGIDDLLARTPEGSLWFYPGNRRGAYAAPTKIGKFGWEIFDALTSIGDFNGDGKNDLLARKPDGTLWLYPGTGRVDATSSGYAAPLRIGDFGWDAFTTLTSPGDMNSDGKPDLLARKADGSLWMYAGTGRVDGTNKGYVGGKKIGDFGWEVFDQLFGVGDYNSDGKNDVIARMPDGTLWLYPGDGVGRLAGSKRVGTGWNIFDTLLGAGKLDVDNFADLVGRQPDGSLWAYSGTGMQPNEGYLGRTFAAAL